MQVLAAKEQYELVKVDREQAQTDVLAHGRVIAKLKREEVEAAERITDDHVEACDRGKSLGDIFPSIRVRTNRKAVGNLVDSKERHRRDEGGKNVLCAHDGPKPPTVRPPFFVETELALGKEPSTTFPPSSPIAMSCFFLRSYEPGRLYHHQALR